MKKLILISCFILLLASKSVFANSQYFISYGGKTFKLLHSEKKHEHNGFYNQYFKLGETPGNWTEEISVQHFPNIYSPIELAQIYKGFLAQYKCPSALLTDENQNQALLDFILIDTNAKKNIPIIIEFNVFKFNKSPVCGTIAVQYAKRFTFTDTSQIEKEKKKFEKFRAKTLKNFLDFEIPKIITLDIDEIKLNDLH